MEDPVKFEVNDIVWYSNTGKFYRVVKIEGTKLGVYRKNNAGSDVGRYLLIDPDKCGPAAEQDPTRI
jgi:hypothetical protein